MKIRISRRSYSSESSLVHKVFDLLETSFVGIGQAREKSESLGVFWGVGSTPFVQFEDHKAISHVGVIKIPVFFKGKSVSVAGIHAVCTRPEYRRRGLFRQLMKEAMAFVDQHFENSVLFTAQPQLYTPYDFRVVPEYVFKTPYERKLELKEVRQLDLKDPRTVSLLHRLLERRRSISNIFGLGPEKGIFCFNEGSGPLFYLESHDVLISMEMEGSRLHLFDIVGPKIPSLSEIVENIDECIEEVWIYFYPDQLGVKAEPEPIVLHGDSYLMARGPLSFESIQFMWPRTGRC